eukprot:TRINITY_DN1107_c0_g1_i1.p1 TRINITY_DN1107_c0_g1~~TRINITY_DN1107_c0_g1_i1.p1  ORF type:complete len:404 (+),score=88.26 TRINITY_DN1107_c0_g1_i1:125-1336(+)
MGASCCKDAPRVRRTVVKRKVPKLPNIDPGAYVKVSKDMKFLVTPTVWSLTGKALEGNLDKTGTVLRVKDGWAFVRFKFTPEQALDILSLSVSLPTKHLVLLPGKANNLSPAASPATTTPNLVSADEKQSDSDNGKPVELNQIKATTINSEEPSENGDSQSSCSSSLNPDKERSHSTGIEADARSCSSDAKSNDRERCVSNGKASEEKIRNDVVLQVSEEDYVGCGAQSSEEKSCSDAKSRNSDEHSPSDNENSKSAESNSDAKSSSSDAHSNSKKESQNESDDSKSIGSNQPDNNTAIQEQESKSNSKEAVCSSSETSDAHSSSKEESQNESDDSKSDLKKSTSSISSNQPDNNTAIQEQESKSNSKDAACSSGETSQSVSPVFEEEDAGVAASEAPVIAPE